MRNKFKIELRIDLASDDEERRAAVHECLRDAAQSLLAQATFLAGQVPPRIALEGENNLDGKTSIPLFKPNDDEEAFDDEA